MAENRKVGFQRGPLPARLNPLANVKHTNKISPLALDNEKKSQPREKDRTLRSERSDIPDVTFANPVQDEAEVRNITSCSNLGELSAERRGSIKDTLEKFTLTGDLYRKTESDDGGKNKPSFIQKRLWTMLQPNDNKLSMKLFGSKRGIQKEKKRLKAAGFFIIHPCSSFRSVAVVTPFVTYWLFHCVLDSRFYWDLVMVLLLMANLIVLPVIISFFRNEELSAGWITFNCFSDTFFMLDVVFNFRTGVMDHKTAEQVILQPAVIAVHYLKTWFAIDVVSAVPFDYIFLLLDEDGNPKLLDISRALRILRLFKLLSLLRLLRLSRLLRFVRQWEQVFNVANAFMKIFKLICMMMLISHWNGCLQFLVPMLQDFPSHSWVTINGLIDASWWDQYSWAVFKAMSHMLCIGYGRFPPQSLTDLWLTMISMVSGATCFALFIGHATNLIQSMDTSSRQYREKVAQVEEYMAYRKLPKDMRDAVMDFYEHRYNGKMFDEEKIYGEISQTLRMSIANYNCRDLVASVPFFHGADPTFVARVVSFLKFELFQPGDIIIKEGTFGDRMYFIQQGIVDIITAEGSLATSLSDGSFFGEICLLTEERRVATVQSETYCQLYSLSVDNFQMVLNEYPEMRRTMEQIALRRLTKIGRSSSLLRSKILQSADADLMFKLPAGSSICIPKDKPPILGSEASDSEQLIRVTNTSFTALDETANV